MNHVYATQETEAATDENKNIRRNTHDKSTKSVVEKGPESNRRSFCSSVKATQLIYCNWQQRLCLRAAL